LPPAGGQTCGERNEADQVPISAHSRGNPRRTLETHRPALVGESNMCRHDRSGLGDSIRVTDSATETAALLVAKACALRSATPS
jgi:hypothetical protein